MFIFFSILREEDDYENPRDVPPPTQDADPDLVKEMKKQEGHAIDILQEFVGDSEMEGEYTFLSCGHPTL